MKNMGNKRTAKAYFTVEAALVLPVVLGVILFILYLFFYQYDRCMIEQNAGVLAMRGCTLQETDKEEVARQLLAQAKKEDKKKYLAFCPENAQITLQKNRVKVEQSGELNFPFHSLVFRGDGKTWKSRATYENHRISPVIFVRNCRKIMGGK